MQKKETAAKQHGKITKRNSSTKFPIDFFEHCHPTNDVEFGGVDVLHVYNTNQVKTRLNAAGMYIANTKVSESLYLNFFESRALKSTNPSPVEKSMEIQPW